jgi:hypothetical protein
MNNKNLAKNHLPLQLLMQNSAMVLSSEDKPEYPNTF